MTTLSNTKGVVTVESVQAMIDALPDAKNINDDNMEKVRTQFQAVVDAMQQLTAEEQRKLDTSRYRKVAAVLYGRFGRSYAYPRNRCGMDDQPIRGRGAYGLDAYHIR